MSFNIMRIPADMVVSAISMAIVAHAHANQASGTIYHVGSSLRNPLDIAQLHKVVTQHFIEKPLMNKNGNPIRVKNLTVHNTMAHFRMYMTIRAILPLKVCYYKYSFDLLF